MGKLLHMRQIVVCGRSMIKPSKKSWEAVDMKQYECKPCGYIYDEAAGDPDNGIAPGTKWEDLPADWVCPICGVGKEEFNPL